MSRWHVVADEVASTEKGSDMFLEGACLEKAPNCRVVLAVGLSIGSLLDVLLTRISIQEMVIWNACEKMS